MSGPQVEADEVGTLCQLGCVETDPDPTAPGVFLGSGVTPDACFLGGYTDADQDGLGDFCEKNLAAAFAPELFYSSADNVGREPYWVTQGEVETERVRLGYLISYYRDEGSTAWGCGLPGAPSSCDGHNGDTEAIFLDVYFDGQSQHWVVDQAFYSQHGNFVLYARGSDPYPLQLFYPGHAGSHPRSYVAEGKHANYASKRA